ncbi:hypothetical protein [Paenibacillus sp. KN14-4R]|uniref:hypothetical protein n=1 Tax=Paenibacillus sp. KN14-4R TaxID=3445773 RepID=UPI003F9F542D
MWTRALHTKSIEILRTKVKNSLMLAVFFFVSALLESYVGTHLASGQEQAVAAYVLIGMGLLLGCGIFFMVRSMVTQSVIMSK